MPEIGPSRKARFKAALAIAGITAKQWCAARRITRSHLHAVLTGKRESAVLLADVDAFIAAHPADALPAMAAA